jgi:DNA modification methylase
MTEPSPHAFRDRIVELRRVRAGDLLEHPRNWRRHPKRQVDALRAILGEIGFSAALIAREEDGRLILVDGHLRRSLGPEQIVPVLVLDVTEAEADKLLATLDPLTGLAEANPEALRDLLARVTSSSEAVRRLLADLSIQAGKARGNGDPEEIPPVPQQPRSRLGDLWVLGDHRVLCGDARSAADLARLTEGERARMLWTDPPYGVGYVGRTRAALRIQNDDEAGIAELLAVAFEAIDEVLAPGAAIYVAHPAGPAQATFVQAFLARGWILRQSLVWVKDALVIGHADYHYRHEPILYGHTRAGRWGRGAAGWYGGNAESSVLEIPRPRSSREHPTAKPVELVRRCVANSSAPGDVVLDPFLGSGSTLIACEQLGRRLFGVELDPAYADVAVSRWEAFTGRRATRQGSHDGQ